MTGPWRAGNPAAEAVDPGHGSSAATSEVGGAVLTAVATTVIGFLPVFTLVAAEGKLFRPLAFTKTFALLAAVLVAVVVIPPVAHLLLKIRSGRPAPVVPGSVPVARRDLRETSLLAVAAAVSAGRPAGCPWGRTAACC